MTHRLRFRGAGAGASRTEATGADALHQIGLKGVDGACGCWPYASDGEWMS
jgi:hypothetical protein